MTEATHRRWDAAAWVAASHLAVLAGCVVILALVRQWAPHTLGSYFVIGAGVATPLALLMAYVWRQLARAGAPAVARVIALAIGGAIVGVPGAIVFPLVLGLVGEHVTVASAFTGGLVVSAAGFWCGLLSPLFRRVMLRNFVTVGVFVVSAALTALAFLP